MPAQRSSLRVLKRPRKDASPPPPVSATGAAAAGSAAAGKKATGRLVPLFYSFKPVTIENSQDFW